MKSKREPIRMCGSKISVTNLGSLKTTVILWAPTYFFLCIKNTYEYNILMF